MAHAVDEPAGRGDRLVLELEPLAGRSLETWRESLTLVPALTPSEALAQIRFAKAHGAVGVCMRPFERDRMMTDPYYYPIYDETERLGIPITVHLDGSPDLLG